VIEEHQLVMQLEKMRAKFMLQTLLSGNRDKRSEEMTENLMTKLNAEDTTLLVKLSQARGDHSLSDTLTDLIEEQYGNEVAAGVMKWEDATNFESQLEALANFYGWTPAEEIHELLTEACDYEAVTL